MKIIKAIIEFFIYHPIIDRPVDLFDDGKNWSNKDNYD